MMARSRAPSHLRSLPAAYLGSVLVLISCFATPARLFPAAGTSCQLDLGNGRTETFQVRLEADWALELAVEQQGLDVAIEVGTIEGRQFGLADLPLGPHAREELTVVVGEATDLAIEISAIGGRGTASRLEVRSLGPATADQRQSAGDLASYWRAERAPREVGRKIFRRLIDHASERRVRISAALKLFEMEWANDQTAALGNLDLALAELLPGDLVLRGQLLAQRAQLLDVMGKKEAARKAFVEAREIADKSGDLAAAGLVEAGLGKLGWDANDAEAAIQGHASARDYFEAAGYDGLARDQEFFLARSQMRLGSSPEPLARLMMLLAAVPESGDAQERLQRERLLREIGWWHWLEDQSADALPLFEKAVELGPGTFANYQRLALVQLNLGLTAAARKTLRAGAGAVRTQGDRASFDACICLADFQEGLHSEARRRCASARESFELAGQLGPLSGIDLTLARIAQSENDLEQAESHARRACAAVEKQRVLAGGVQNRLDFLAVRTEPLEMLVELRLGLNSIRPGAAWDVAALEASETTRSRLLRDLLAAGPEERTVGGADLQRRAAELRAELGEKARELVRGLLEVGRVDGQAAARLEPLLHELDGLREKQTTASPTETTEEAAFDLAAIQDELEPETVLLVFHLGPADAFGWAVTSRAVRGTPLGKAASLRAWAGAVHHQMAGSAPPSTAAVNAWMAKLSEHLWSPFAAELLASRQVVVVAPPALQQVSFAALPFPANSGRPIIASHTIAQLPAAAVLPALRHKPSSRQSISRLLTIVDDPIYDDDPRLAPKFRRPGPFVRLPDTAAEAEDLLALAGPGRGLRLSGFEASREQLMDGALSGSQIVHFATHTRTDEPHRGLVLSRFDAGGQPIGDHFGFAELSALHLEAELAVISACSSALGQNIAGEGLLGLSQGFLAAGIPRLLLTLWPIRGEPARRLIRGFYRELLAGASPAESLRLTQLAMISEGRGPREWAAFALYGDWRPFPQSKNSSEAGQHEIPSRVLDIRERSRNRRSRRIPS